MEYDLVRFGLLALESHIRLILFWYVVISQATSFTRHAFLEKLNPNQPCYGYLRCPSIYVTNCWLGFTQPLG